MRKTILLIIGAIAVTSGVVSWTMERRARVALEATQEKLRDQTAELTRLRAEGEQLSNAISRAGESQTLSGAQFRELLRLRGKLGLLRAEQGNAEELQSSNRTLSAALARSGSTSTAESSWTREQLNNAGYADPESAVVTTFWALSQDNVDVQSSILTREERDFFDARASNGVPVDVATYCRKLGELLNPASATGIHLVKKQVNSPDEALLDFYYDGEGKTRRFRMVRVAGAWKLGDLVSITAN